MAKLIDHQVVADSASSLGESIDVYRHVDTLGPLDAQKGVDVPCGLDHDALVVPEAGSHTTQWNVVDASSESRPVEEGHVSSTKRVVLGIDENGGFDDRSFVVQAAGHSVDGHCSGTDGERRLEKGRCGDIDILAGPPVRRDLAKFPMRGRRPVNWSPDRRCA